MRLPLVDQNLRNFPNNGFLSNIFHHPPNQLSVQLNIDQIFTTPYTPSTNGAIERLHRTMNSMLSKVIADNQKDWCEHLPFVMAAYRSAVHSSTNFSPNFLVFGREVNAPIDLMLGRPEGVEYQSTDDYVEMKLTNMERAHQLAREALQSSSARNKIRYDVRVHPKKLQIGDWVWCYSPRRYVGKSPKFQRNYSGPYLVIRRLSPVLLVIQKSPRSKEILVHQDKLKACHGEHPLSWLHKVSAPVHAELQSATPSPLKEPALDAACPITPLVTPLRAEAPPFILRTVDSAETYASAPSSEPAPTPNPAQSTRPKRTVVLPARYRQ